MSCLVLHFSGVSFLDVGLTFCLGETAMLYRSALIFFTTQVLLLLGLFTASASATTARPYLSPPQASAEHGGSSALEKRFEQNIGQADQRVKYLLRGSAHSLFLTDTGAVIKLSDKHALTLSLPNSNPTPVIAGLTQLSSSSHYLIGNDPRNWQRNVPHFNAVQYQDVYPGIELVYYGKENTRELEYDFIVAPGADYKHIALSFAGADSMTIDSIGNLVIELEDRKYIQRAPIVYQQHGKTKKTVLSKFVFRNSNTIGFQVATYDETKPLVIDPVLSFSTYLGGSATDFATQIAVDDAGNSYITGNILSADFPTTSPVQAVHGDGGGANDAFVTKIDTNGNVVYSTYLGGAGTDVGGGIAVDSNGNAYVTGFTLSADFPTTTGSLKPIYQNFDGFVVKLNADGSNIEYGTYLGGNGVDIAQSIAVDSAFNTYITGQTNSSTFPTVNPLKPSLSGANDIFIAKLNATGSALLFSTYFGGSNDLASPSESGGDIAVDDSGNITVSGETSASDFPTASINPSGALQSSSAGGRESFILKIDSSAPSLQYSTYFGGSDTDVIRDLALDDLGRATFTGTTLSDLDFPITAGAYQTTFGGDTANGDAFVARLEADGSALAYSSYLGGSGLDSGIGIDVDAVGNAYVTGTTTSTDFPIQNAFQPTRAGSNDAFIAKLDNSGSNLIFSSFLGGSLEDQGAGVGVDASNNIYLAGHTVSSNFPTLSAGTQPVYQDSYGGARDGFVAKIVQDLDSDGDGVLDVSDNCPGVANTDQSDNDSDTLGDVCDDDDDNDGVLDTADNCPTTLGGNADQTDTDMDGAGDICDNDLDGDGVDNGSDNCPIDPNAGQADNDGDLAGDACDADDDNDGVLDDTDNCPFIDNAAQADLDGDNIGDQCDADLDGDGVDNNLDNCPLDSNAGQDDVDSDTLGDACDPDDDNDGVLDADDNCQATPNPDQTNTDGVGGGDACDEDDDDDGVLDGGDNCPFTANAAQSDFDNDGLGDACDNDVDNDGVVNGLDICGFTLQGEIVDPALGCSIAELCPCDGPHGTSNDWRNHGKYVSCVAKTAKSFVKQGLISDAERSDLVSVAGQSNCGSN